jgi:anaerobic ribonucleoside-triphosphate reductase
MTAPECPHHHTVMEMIPTEPCSCCRSCGYATHELECERCPECGHPMELEAAEPHWYCPYCPAELWHGKEQELLLLS